MFLVFTIEIETVAVNETDVLDGITSEGSDHISSWK